MSPAEYARIRHPKNLKRLEGPFVVDGPMYGRLTALMGFKGSMEFILLVDDPEHAVRLFKLLGVEPMPHKMQKVAICQSSKVRRK